MNYSTYSADRTTHLKIVAIAFVAGVGVASFGTMGRINAGDQYYRAERAINAGKAALHTVASPSRCQPSRSLCST
jgi:hypothetical protein